jgi:putative transposase
MSSKDLKIRKRHVAHMHGFPQWRGHLDEAFVRIIVTDRLRAYSAAMVEIGVVDRHEAGRRLNNRAENSHQPFRRRERAMQRFRSLKTLQKFSSVHAQVHNQFNQDRHLVARQVYKQSRSAALAEWRALAA